jgi:hypothetical protein
MADGSDSLQKPVNVNVVLAGRADEALAKVLAFLPEPAAPQTAAQKLAEERSHQDTLSGNESARSATQVLILINGGAATAILAYLAKETSTAHGIFAAASVSLALYAIGVAFGAMSMWSKSLSLLYFAQYHEAILNKDDWKLQDAFREGEIWLYRHRMLFVSGILVFIISSFWLAAAFVRSIPGAPGIIAIDLVSFVLLLIIACVVAGVLHYGFKYYAMPGQWSFWSKVVVGWVGAWGGSTFWHWWPGGRYNEVYFAPAVIGSLGLLIVVIYLEKLFWSKTPADLPPWRAGPAESGQRA